MTNLKEMKAKEIKELAKSYGIKNWWTKKKDQLITEIEELQRAGEEAIKATKEEDEKEKTAVAEYTANWSKYTKRYNVGEFLDKWKAGKIVLESEKAEIDEQIDAEEKEHTEYANNIGKVDLPDGEVEQPVVEVESEPEEEIKPFVYTDADGETWEDYDIGEMMKNWSQEKKDAFKKYFEEVFLGNGGFDAHTDDALKIWSDTYDADHGVTKEKKVTNCPTPKRGAQIEFNGKSQNICAWAKELGVSANTLYGRLYKLGWSVEKAFSKK